MVNQAGIFYNRRNKKRYDYKEGRARSPRLRPVRAAAELFITAGTMAGAVDPSTGLVSGFAMHYIKQSLCSGSPADLTEFINQIIH